MRLASPILLAALALALAACASRSDRITASPTVPVLARESPPPAG